MAKRRDPAAKIAGLLAAAASLALAIPAAQAQERKVGYIDVHSHLFKAMSADDEVAAFRKAGIAGVICDVLPSTGTTANTDVNVQKDGIANVLLSAGEAVVGGSPLVTKGTDGSVMAFAKGTHKDCDIIGYSEVTRTAGGGSSELIPATLQIVHVGDQS